MESTGFNSPQRFFKDTIASNGFLVFNVKPIIKINLNGMLLYANDAGVRFLDLLSETLKVPAITYLLEECPVILEPHCSLDLCCNVKDLKYYFSVVAFKEAGYVGLYGYRLIHLNAPGIKVA